MTGDTEADDVCPNCGDAFGWDSEEDTFERVDTNDAEVHRHGEDGGLLVCVEFDCPECGHPLLIEDAFDGAFGTDSGRIREQNRRERRARA